MSDENDLDVVRRLLKQAGVQVQGIPTTTAKRCDLRAQDGGEQYLIEVKGFHDDQAIGETLRAGELHQAVLSYDYRPAVEDRIDVAVKQLTETAAGSEKELRLVALLVRTRFDAEVTRQQILGAVYGKKSLIGPSSPEHFECLYFAESAFFRYRKVLDGAIVVDHKGGVILCMNDYGSRLERLRQSKLGWFFAENGALYHATAWEKQGYLIADCDTPRRDVQKIIEYLEEQYGKKGLRKIEFKRYTAIGNPRVHDNS